MPSPDDSFALLEPAGQLQPNSYIREFARYRWARIVGFPNLVDLFREADGGFAKHSDVKDHIAGQRLRAVRSILPGWKKRFEEHSDWGQCTPQQILAACGSREMRFDKACLAIRTLEIVFAETPALRDVDIYEFVALRPAAFALRTTESKTLGLLRGANLTPQEAADRRDLIGLLSPADGLDEKLDRATEGSNFLQEVAEGYGITLPNATAIATFFQAKLELPKPEFVLLGTRTERTTDDLRCNQFESPFVGLQQQKLKKLLALIQKKSARSK